MSIRLNGFPFDSQITGYGADGLPEYDRASNSEEFASLLHGFWRDGVFGTSALTVLAGTGLTATVGTGSILIQGRVARVTEAKTLAFDTANSQPRFDRVVARCDLSNAVRDIVLDVVKGTPASSPVAPALTRNQSVWELCLATVRIPAGATVVQQSNITDTRIDNDLCGIVAATMTDVDTSRFYDQVQGDLSDFRTNEQAKLSAFFAQKQQDFNTWFNELQSVLDENAAANLTKRIVELENNMLQTYEHTKSGTVHALTLDGGENINLKFVSTARFDAGDTFTINGEPVNALMPDGNELSDGFFVEGAVVIGFCNSQTNTIYFVGGGKVQWARNLLDNSDFRNPINQRGQETYAVSSSDGAYSIDRWMLRNANLDVKTGTVTRNNGDLYIGQSIDKKERYSGKTLTFAVKIKSGEGTFAITNSNRPIYYGTGLSEEGSIHGAGVYCVSAKMPEQYEEPNLNVIIRSADNTGQLTIEWAALYEGEYTTDNVPPYVPKGYAAELAECQRYCLALNYNGEKFFAGFGEIRAGGLVNAYFHLPVPMRVIPSLSNTDASGWAIKNGGESVTPTNVSVWFSSMNGILGLKFTVPENTNRGNIIVNYNSGEILIISAEL